MKPYMATVVAEEHLLVFQRIEQAMQKLPDIELESDTKGKQLVSCHIIARALARIFPEVRYQDGYFARRGQRHSWLIVRDDPRLIIDPYPIALLGGPIMVHGGFVTTPWDELYIKTKLTNLGGAQFRTHVNQVTKILKHIST